MGGELNAEPAARARRLLIVDLKDVAAAPLTVEAAARGYQVERVQGDELDEAIVASGAVTGADLRRLLSDA